MSGKDIVYIVKKGAEKGEEEDYILDLAKFNPVIQTVETNTISIRFDNPGDKWLLFFHPYFFETIGYTTVHTYLLSEEASSSGGAMMLYDDDEMMISGGAMSSGEKTKGLPLPFSLFFKLFHVFHLFSFSWKYRPPPPPKSPTYKMDTNGEAGKLPLYQKYLPQGDADKPSGSVFSNISNWVSTFTSGSTDTEPPGKAPTISDSTTSPYWEIRMAKEEFDHHPENERIQREIIIRKKYQSPLILLPPPPPSPTS
jgi:hypothetical protein